MGTSVLVETFSRHRGALHAEDVPLGAIAAEVGTPAFVYSAGHIRARIAHLRDALLDVPHQVHFSLKANASRAVLTLMRESGCGADVVSGGELFRAVRAGFEANDIVFGGVGKTAREIEQGIALGVKCLNVESVAELELANRIARSMGRTINVGLRVNPEVEVESEHDFIKTGEKSHKFGIPCDEVNAAVRGALAMKNVRLRGLAMHVGSQLRTLEAHRAGTDRLVMLADDARTAGAQDLEFLDLGGGLPVRYNAEDEADVEGFGALARHAAARSRLSIVVEPGRFLVANAGVLLTRVLYRKRNGGVEYVVVDAGMTELLRPSHYDSFHRIESVADRTGSIVADVVGPVCESGDFLARAREMADVGPGDLLAVHSVGAYGFVMASHYNARPHCAEVMVDGARWALATARETYADLVRHERAHLEWRTA